MGPDPTGATATLSGVTSPIRPGTTIATAELLERIEDYYDTVPRATATVREVGPFSLFVATEGWPYYARPRRGDVGAVTARDVDTVLAAQQELGVPRQIEWVHEITPSLLVAARSAGMPVQECPLLVLRHELSAGAPDGIEVSVLQPDNERFAAARAAVAAGFAERDELRPEPVFEWISNRVRRRLLSVVGAFDSSGAAVGGGSHAVRDQVSELTGIAVLPGHRRRGIGAAITQALTADAIAAGATTVFLSADGEDVARVYQRVGFERLGTACIAEP